MWQVGGDMETLLNVFTGSDNQYKTPDPLAMGMGHCSALLRLLPDYSDLFVAQDTWSDFSSMLRILKRYNFEMLKSPQYPDIPAPGNTMTFSSYPGVLFSDLPMLKVLGVSQETTIGYANSSLNQYIRPTSVLEGVRTMVANRLAASGREWAQIFSLSNSGTYNNEWMIVDYKLFRPGQVIPVPGLFTVLDQIPGTIMYDDLTLHLYKYKYFGSYNTPFFPEIFNKSGQPALVAKYGDWFTHDKTPRALIFKRDAPKVNDLNSMIKLMRYNNFKNDPLSRCNCTPPYSAENAIAARCDLNPANGTYPFGALGHRPHTATDMKVTTFEMAKSLSFRAVSSPPHDDLPVFQWSTSSYKDLSHVGHPDIWKFPVITFNGTNPMA
ncbi:phospholipase b lamina ancestor [Plakobranchus ocellatus]|uniref:Phospholipase B-like n=1 Tax=Plakobranchus ocellatus TaxID=259542 RepID=A0AAV4BDJ7_9GAST|nr:phospholipase b lamina ancestor [Plakobranchus ocellatus]